MRAPACAALLCALQLALNGCGASRKPALPPPTYERWVLPEWAPPETPAYDPTDELAGMEGDWVTGEGEGEGEGDVDGPTQGNEGAAGGAEEPPNRRESPSETESPSNAASTGGAASPGGAEPPNGPESASEASQE